MSDTLRESIIHGLRSKGWSRIDAENEADDRIAAMQADAAPVADRVSTSSPVAAHKTPETSDKLRDALEVFRDASDAATRGSVKYKPSAEQAAAAVIEADRAALVAEIVAWLRQPRTGMGYVGQHLAEEIEAKWGKK